MAPSRDDDLRELQVGQAKQLTLLENLDKKVDELNEKLRRNSLALFGDGDKTVGMVVRIDRLEQNHERAKWFARALGGAVLSLLVGAIWAVLKAKLP